MMTIGLIEVGDERVDYMPNTVHGSKLVQLVQKNQRQLERAISNPKLDAVAIFGLSPRKKSLAEKVLREKKHVFVDFPVAEAFQKAAKLGRTATKEGQRIYSPNLLRTEPGLKELKRNIQNSSSKLLSLTVTCGVKAKPGGSAFRMKAVQVLDVLEWLADSRLREVATQRTTIRSSAAALVTLASFDSGVTVMLNMYSTPARSNHPRLWIDAVFTDSVVQVNPHAQSIRVTLFQNESVESRNWATPSLVEAIEEFISCMKSDLRPLELENLKRIFKLADMVVGV